MSKTKKPLSKITTDSIVKNELEKLYNDIKLQGVELERKYFVKASLQFKKDIQVRLSKLLKEQQEQNIIIEKTYTQKTNKSPKGKKEQITIKQLNNQVIYNYKLEGKTEKEATQDIDKLVGGSLTTIEIKQASYKLKETK